MKPRFVAKALAIGTALVLPWSLFIWLEVEKVFVGRIVWQMRVSEPSEPRPIQLRIREYEAGFANTNRYSFGFYDEGSCRPIAGDIFWVKTDSVMASRVFVRKTSEAQVCYLVFSEAKEDFLRVEGKRVGGEQKWNINEQN